ncbi:hypothetical protein [Pedobacter punctiformis]|uniref:DUF1795 domain-containing protein n=1 Tax=Pedobacter punctiformis TaxID=3004097 RepID=A0ABT4L4A7_9SPHI|nr:hypothetical protein [Pedobacter sp. HCMS5-2]MCZ4242758.1 hypothetical protein [Pedobacter sp. HCMS5-2]
MKKIRFVSFSVIITFLFVACNYKSGEKPPPVTYSKDGLSMSLPKYWKVTKDRPIEGVDSSRIISITNKEPFSKDAYLVITSVNEKEELDKVLENLIQSLRASHSKRNIEFGLLDKVQKVKVGNIDALRVGFETKIVTTRNNGTLTVFNLNKKTYSFVFNSDVKESKENSGVVDSAIKSLKVN